MPKYKPGGGGRIASLLIFWITASTDGAPFPRAWWLTLGGEESVHAVCANFVIRMLVFCRTYCTRLPTINADLTLQHACNLSPPLVDKGQL
jgi:hypothetical protein